MGGNLTIYRSPLAIKPFYGDYPVSVLFYLRFRIKGKDQMVKMHMP